MWNAKHDLHERDDDLAHCKVCGGAEASLPHHCPGVRMTAEQERAIQTNELDFLNGKWVIVAGENLNVTFAGTEPDERQLFEDAAYAHYLKQRNRRPIYQDTAEVASRETMFARSDSGDYIAVIYNAAWWGWRMAKGVA